MAEPLYRQIAQDLWRKIESGDLAPGAQLPNAVEFRDEYDVSRNTVRDAIKWLTIRGLVETRPGQGTFVVARIEPIVTTLSDDRDPEAGMAGGEGAAAPRPSPKLRNGRGSARGTSGGRPDTRMPVKKPSRVTR